MDYSWSSCENVHKLSHNQQSAISRCKLEAEALELYENNSINFITAMAEHMGIGILDVDDELNQYFLFIEWIVDNEEHFEAAE